MALESKSLSGITHTNSEEVVHISSPVRDHSSAIVGAWLTTTSSYAPARKWPLRSNVPAHHSVFLSFHGDDSAIPARLREIMSEVEELEDDWDGCGALAPTESIISVIRRIVTGQLRALPTPELTANENGTITVEWRVKRDYASLEIGSTRFAFMMRSEGNRTRFLNGRLGDLNPTMALEIDDALFQPAPSIVARDGSWAFKEVGV